MGNNIEQDDFGSVATPDLTIGFVIAFSSSGLVAVSLTPTTSVLDVGLDYTSIVYPNPSTGEVRIRCSSPTPPERWGLTSINGQAIASGALTPNEAHPIDGSYMVRIGTDVPKGTYLLTLYGEQGTVVCTQNVVRQ